ncbi:MAG: hypothetical protein P1U34_01545 [Coxiellaceae bacterium]|nr:hypothetical protein [Coxiellaceae bacterium]
MTQQQVQYYPVSIFKLLVMSFFTFGFYIFFIWYRNWQYITRRDDSHKSSFWRSFFMIFTVYALFRDVDHQATQQDKRGIPGCMWFATWFVISLIAASYVALFASISTASGELWILLVNYSGLIALVPLQQTINRLNHGHLVNAHLTMLDAVIILVCLGLWAMMIYVTFFHPEMLSMQNNLQTYQALFNQLQGN